MVSVVRLKVMHQPSLVLHRDGAVRTVRVQSAVSLKGRASAGVPDWCAIESAQSGTSARLAF
ncbi:hypothetical protein DF3PB_4120004 [uncultured Defluviicoccus sp.]|uniref:Uncharacterized protein n=1 Tax=metagenome TaxID=256318 RepID=A0A380TFW4_9ZZZZ|nr:hypothetical protein DF3PB_4120004 [uncultured Defluviicoccus sp.]